jgi:hypothetical protein
MAKKTQREIDHAAFVSGLEVWEGHEDKRSIALTWVEGLEIHAGYIVLETVGDNGEENAFAKPLDVLIARWAEIHSNDHPDDHAAEQATMVAVLERALAVVKASKADQ